MIHTGIRYVGLEDRGLKYEIQSKYREMGEMLGSSLIGLVDGWC